MGCTRRNRTRARRLGGRREEKLRICAHSTQSVFNSQRHFSLPATGECRAFSNAKFSKSRDIYLIVSSARARALQLQQQPPRRRPRGPGGPSRSSVGRGRRGGLARSKAAGGTNTRDVQCTGTNGQNDLSKRWPFASPNTLHEFIPRHFLMFQNVTLTPSR